MGGYLSKTHERKVNLTHSDVNRIRNALDTIYGLKEDKRLWFSFNPFESDDEVEQGTDNTPAAAADIEAPETSEEAPLLSGDKPKTYDGKPEASREAEVATNNANAGNASKNIKNNEADIDDSVSITGAMVDHGAFCCTHPLHFLAELYLKSDDPKEKEIYAKKLTKYFDLIDNDILSGIAKSGEFKKQEDVTGYSYKDVIKIYFNALMKYDKALCRRVLLLLMIFNQDGDREPLFTQPVIINGRVRKFTSEIEKYLKREYTNFGVTAAAAREFIDKEGPGALKLDKPDSKNVSLQMVDPLSYYSYLPRIIDVQVLDDNGFPQKKELNIDQEQVNLIKAVLDCLKVIEDEIKERGYYKERVYEIATEEPAQGKTEPQQTRKETYTELDEGKLLKDFNDFASKMCDLVKWLKETKFLLLNEVCLKALKEISLRYTACLSKFVSNKEIWIGREYRNLRFLRKVIVVPPNIKANFIIRHRQIFSTLISYLFRNFYPKDTSLTQGMLEHYQRAFGLDIGVTVWQWIKNHKTTLAASAALPVSIYFNWVIYNAIVTFPDPSKIWNFLSTFFGKKTEDNIVESERHRDAVITKIQEFQANESLLITYMAAFMSIQYLLNENQLAAEANIDKKIWGLDRNPLEVMLPLLTDTENLKTIENYFRDLQTTTTDPVPLNALSPPQLHQTGTPQYGRVGTPQHQVRSPLQNSARIRAGRLFSDNNAGMPPTVPRPTHIRSETPPPSAEVRDSQVLPQGSVLRNRKSGPMSLDGYHHRAQSDAAPIRGTHANSHHNQIHSWVLQTLEPPASSPSQQNLSAQQAQDLQASVITAGISGLTLFVANTETNATQAGDISNVSGIDKVQEEISPDKKSSAQPKAEGVSADDVDIAGIDDSSHHGSSFEEDVEKSTEQRNSPEDRSAAVSELPVLTQQEAATSELASERSYRDMEYQAADGLAENPHERNDNVEDEDDNASSHSSSSSSFHF